MKDDVPTCLSKELARMGGSANITACSVPRWEGLRKSMLPGYYRYPTDEAARMYPILRLLSLWVLAVCAPRSLATCPCTGINTT
jgi:hypothetical protein